MPFEKDVDERVWCPGPWPWEWFDTCVKRKHKWCYNFSWVKKTAYGIVIYHEACENGELYTWFEAGLGIGTLDTFVPVTEMCFDSPRDHEGVCDGSNTGLAASPLTADQYQDKWRWCRRCYALFYDGYSDKGLCPRIQLKLTTVASITDLVNAGRDLVVVALVGSQLHVRVFDDKGVKVVDQSEGELADDQAVADLKLALRDADSNSATIGERRGRIVSAAATVAGRTPESVGGHRASGFDYRLPHDIAPSAWAQQEWRYCHKCHAMYYDGYSGKGACPAAGGHVAKGFNFVLPHDVAESASTQAGWRYCRKCNAMYYNGHRSKGVCPAGGGHTAAGFKFVLPHK